MFSEVA